MFMINITSSKFVKKYVIMNIIYFYVNSNVIQIDDI